MTTLSEYRDLKFPKKRKIMCPKTGQVIIFGEDYFAVYKNDSFLGEITIDNILNKNIILKVNK